VVEVRDDEEPPARVVATELVGKVDAQDEFEEHSFSVSAEELPPGAPVQLLLRAGTGPEATSLGTLVWEVLRVKVEIE